MQIPNTKITRVVLGFFCGPELLAKESKRVTPLSEVNIGKYRYVSRWIPEGDQDTLAKVSTVKESDSRGNWESWEIHSFPLSEVLPTKLHLSYI
jgi:hypothetical protein